MARYRGRNKRRKSRTKQKRVYTLGRGGIRL